MDIDFREHDPSWRQEWHYYDENNNKVSGWVKSGDGWYYFDDDGVMQKDAIVLEHGNEFKLGPDGKLIDSSSNTEYLENQNKVNKKTDKKNYNESTDNYNESTDDHDESADKYKDENQNSNKKYNNSEESDDN